MGDCGEARLHTCMGPGRGRGSRAGPEGAELGWGSGGSVAWPGSSGVAVAHPHTGEDPGCLLFPQCTSGLGGEQEQARLGDSGVVTIRHGGGRV